MQSISTRVASEPEKDFRRRLDTNQSTRQDAGPAPVAADKPAPAPRDLFKASVPAPQVKVSYTPVDPGQLPVTSQAFDKEDVKDGLVGDRVRISEPRNFSTPHADAEGNYIYTPDNPRFDASQAYVITNRALNMAEGYLGRPLDWGFKESLGRNQLIVHPHAGANTANAFYNSEAGSTNFFSFSDPKTNEVLRTGTMGGVVAHETGHAILDGIRHAYIGGLTVSAGGFHESFGDMTSILTELQDDAVIDRLHAETGGDLSKPNIVSRMAAGLGVAVSHMSNGPEADALRNAINGYKYTDEHFLPYVDRKNPNQLPGQEPHAYSNLFTGAFYDIFNGVYKEVSKDSTRTFKDDVVTARDTAGKLLYRAMEFGPAADPKYKDVALAFIKADQVDNNGQNRPLLEKVFKDRHIVSADDLAAFDKHEASLPTNVTLTEADAKDEDSASKFLTTHAQDLGVPKDVNLELLDVHNNEKGETFMVAGFARDIDLDSPDFGTLEGAKMRTLGGLTLAFDKDGKLIADNFQDVTPRDVEDIKDHLKVASANGALGIGGPDETPYTADGTPKIFVSQTSGSAGPVVQRSPIIWG